jgi:hypothetical protein
VRINKSLITYIPTSGSGSGSVTSVALSSTMPTGLTATITGSPITSSGTINLSLAFSSGYSIPTTTKQGQWDSAYAFTSAFPSGTAQQLLRVNTLGTALEFFTPSYIVSTDIIATSPLVWNSGTKTMSIPVATNSVNGYLSSTDWLTFSSKQPAITLTTTGNNGSATLVGATLNIPTYTLVGLGGMANPFSAALGQIIYSNASGAPVSRAGNTTTTKMFLSSTGDGTNATAPVWEAITAASLGVVPTSRTITINGTTQDLSANRTFSVGTVTSVALSVPTGLSITGSPITTSGTLAITLTAGYSIPTTAKQTEWDSAYTNRITSLTTTGNSGSATLISNTLNVPTYTLAGLGGMSNPFSAAIGQLIYSNSAGAPLSLSPNTTTTKKYLAMTGDGTNGAAPVWEAISGIAGSGTTNYIAKFTSSSAVGNSLIYDTGTNIGINTATPTTISNYISLHIVGGPSGALIRFSDSTAANRGIIYGSTSETAINAVSQFNLYVDNNSTLNATSSGNVKIGGLSATAKFEVNNGSLATSGSGFMVSGGLTNGRLETYQSGTANCIHTVLDAHTYEISAGSTSGYVSGLVITGRSATLLPDRVAIYTRSTQRFQIGSTGQLQLNNYTSASSFTGTPTAYLACDSSGNIITSNPSSGRSTRLAFSAEVPNTWSNMPNTLQFFDSSSAYVTQIDLTAYNQVRLIVNKQGTAGATGSKLLIRYQATTGSPFTESSYLAIGTSEVSVAVDTTNTIITTSWIDLASGAKSDVWVALMGIDGDTTADPVFGNIYAEFRFN